MSEYSQQIKRDIDNFQMAVQKLGTGIKAASALWRDPKYSELSSEMTQIANLSKTVLTAGDKSCEAINILRNGSKCGVYTLICHNPGVTFSRYESIEDRMEQIAKYCVPIDYKDNQYILLPYNLPIKLPQMMDAKATNNCSFLALPIRLRCNNGQPVFQANHITESLHRQTGKKEVFEFPCGIQRGRIINDMIVNVGFVDVGRNDESVFSLCPSHRCFIADLVRFFRGDFSRLKGLAYLVCDDIVLLLSAGNMLILPFGKQKFLICCLWITLIGTDKFAIIGFCGIL